MDDRELVARLARGPIYLNDRLLLEEPELAPALNRLQGRGIVVLLADRWALSQPWKHRKGPDLSGPSHGDK